MLDYNLGDILPVHEHGSVTLLDVMGSDAAIVDAARISYDRRPTSEDRALLRYLMRHRHTSPFEMAELKFELKMPIFVARQWIRHRTASLNEMSARYTQLPDEMFVPEELAVQSQDNKQGRGDQITHVDPLIVDEANIDAYTKYEELLTRGVTRELARGVLPLNTYTKFVWKIDLHNLLHFLKLRLHPHAQKEIRDFAEVIAKLVRLHFPIIYEAFEDYELQAYTCSRMEMDVLRKLLHFYMYRKDAIEPDQVNELITKIDAKAGDTMSKREIAEFKEKFDV